MEGHPPDCPQYCCSDFANFKDDRLGTHSWPHLTNAILPLLCHDKFPKLDSKQYELLDLTLRLASRLLEDDRTVHYVVTMTDGSIHIDHGLDSEPGPERTFAEIDASEQYITGHPTTRLLRYPRKNAMPSNIHSGASVWVTDSMRQRSKEILRSLTGIFDRFEIVEKMYGEGRTDTIDDPVPATASSHFPRARKAMITFPDTMVSAFLRYPNPHDPRRLAEQYILARSFVHELTHVLNQAANGERLEEVYYKNSIYVEAGYDLENALFGGIACMHDLGMFVGHPKEMTGPTVLQELYPSGRLGKQYGDNGAPVGQRAPLDDFSVMQRVPWNFITSMFTDRFWDEDVPRMGSGPIQPSKRSNRPSWVVKLLSPGDSYVNMDGENVVAENPVVWTCNPLDQSLPERVQRVFQDISHDRRKPGPVRR